MGGLKCFNLSQISYGSLFKNFFDVKADYEATIARARVRHTEKNEEVERYL